MTPVRQGFTHTGGGNIDVAQPSPDTVVVTMAGVAVAVGSPCGPGAAGFDFDLSQCLEVVFEKSDVKAEGAIRVPPDDIANHVSAVPRDKPVVAYCT